MSDNQSDQITGQDAGREFASQIKIRNPSLDVLDLSLNDSDIECSQSVCSDTHSDNTTISEMTEKSTVSLSTIHATLSNDEGTEQPHSPSTCKSRFRFYAALLTPYFKATDKKNSSSSTAPSSAPTRGMLLPWGVHKEYFPQIISGSSVDLDIRPGEYVMRSLFSDFTILAEKKIEAVMGEPQEKPLSKTLQRGEDPQFDQLLSAFGCVAEHCLPSLLRALYSWYERQMAEVAHQEQKKSDIKQKRYFIEVPWRCVIINWYFFLALFIWSREILQKPSRGLK
jgi:hypothetical protein